MQKNPRHQLDWHIIAGSLEMEEHLRYGVIKEREFSARHDLFLKIKHPGMKFYQGGWGPELILWPTEGGVDIGRPVIVWATEQRAKEIQQWIQRSMFEIAPGNDPDF